ncbi:MAG: 6-phosphogluconolactonase [Actinomycetales bacterium]|nr:6-phosphogluconolactonase [Actinomycetales bacterium]
MNKDIDVTMYADAAALVSATVTEVIEIISLRLADNGVCHIALTGGSLGCQCTKALIEMLNAHSADLVGLHIWFSDERFDSADSPLRNSQPVRTGLKNSFVTVHEVQSTGDGVNVFEAAASYEAELREVTMDICILGLGPDGHVASLFPNHWDSILNSKVIPITDSPKPPPQRVSFSMNFINQSDQVWIIATGESKALAVTQILDGELSIPAGHVMAAQLTRLIVDAEAFFTE